LAASSNSSVEFIEPTINTFTCRSSDRIRIVADSDSSETETELDSEVPSLARVLFPENEYPITATGAIVQDEDNYQHLSHFVGRRIAPVYGAAERARRLE